MRGGGCSRGGLDYTKWERLVNEISDDEECYDMASKLHLTKLKKPSKIHVHGNGFTVDTDEREEPDVKVHAEKMWDRDFPRMTTSKPPADRRSIQEMIDLAPEFVAEDEIIAPKSKPEPLIQEWSGNAQRWNTVDYSRWDQVDISEHSRDVEDSNEDDFSNAQDIEVCNKFRQDLRGAIESGNEASLRKVLTTAESLVQAGLIDQQELNDGRQALLRRSGHQRDKLLQVSRSESPAPNEEPTHENRARALTVLDLMTRNGGRTESFVWSQTCDHVILHIFVDDVRGADVSLLVHPRLLRASLHAPHQPRPGEFAPPPAEARPVLRVLFEARLAHPVRAEDNETEWELCRVPDPRPEAADAERRALRVVLTKRPPGEHFFPSAVPAWDPEFDGPGAWRPSPLRVWWSRVRRCDPRVDVAALPDRAGDPRGLQATWGEAAAAFKTGVAGMQPVDVTGLIVAEAVEERREAARGALRAAGVPEGSLDWEERIAAAEAEAREAGEAAARAAAAARAERREEQARADEAWRRSEAARRAARRARRGERGAESTDSESATLSTEEGGAGPCDWGPGPPRVGNREPAAGSSKPDD